MLEPETPESASISPALQALSPRANLSAHDILPGSAILSSSGSPMSSLTSHPHRSNNPPNNNNNNNSAKPSSSPISASHHAATTASTSSPAMSSQAGTAAPPSSHHPSHLNTPMLASLSSQRSGGGSSSSHSHARAVPSADASAGSMIPGEVRRSHYHRNNNAPPSLLPAVGQATKRSATQSSSTTSQQQQPASFLIAAAMNAPAAAADGLSSSPPAPALAPLTNQEMEEIGNGGPPPIPMLRPASASMPAYYDTAPQPPLATAVPTTTHSLGRPPKYNLPQQQPSSKPMGATTTSGRSPATPLGGGAVSSGPTPLSRPSSSGGGGLGNSGSRHPPVVVLTPSQRSHFENMKKVVERDETIPLLLRVLELYGLDRNRRSGSPSAAATGGGTFSPRDTIQLPAFHVAKPLSARPGVRTVLTPVEREHMMMMATSSTQQHRHNTGSSRPVTAGSLSQVKPPSAPPLSLLYRQAPHSARLQRSAAPTATPTTATTTATMLPSMERSFCLGEPAPPKRSTANGGKALLDDPTLASETATARVQLGYARQRPSSGSLRNHTPPNFSTPLWSTAGGVGGVTPLSHHDTAAATAMLSAETEAKLHRLLAIVQQHQQQQQSPSSSLPTSSSSQQAAGLLSPQGISMALHQAFMEQMLRDLAQDFFAQMASRAAAVTSSHQPPVGTHQFDELEGSRCGAAAGAVPAVEMVSRCTQTSPNSPRFEEDAEEGDHHRQQAGAAYSKEPRMSLSWARNVAGGGATVPSLKPVPSFTTTTASAAPQKELAVFAPTATTGGATTLLDSSLAFSMNTMMTTPEVTPRHSAVATAAAAGPYSGGGGVIDHRAELRKQIAEERDAIEKLRAQKRSMESALALSMRGGGGGALQRHMSRSWLSQSNVKSLSVEESALAQQQAASTKAYFAPEPPQVPHAGAPTSSPGTAHLPGSIRTDNTAGTSNGAQWKKLQRTLQFRQQATLHLRQKAKLLLEKHRPHQHPHRVVLDTTKDAVLLAPLAQQQLSRGLSFDSSMLSGVENGGSTTTITTAPPSSSQNRSAKGSEQQQQQQQRVASPLDAALVKESAATGASVIGSCEEVPLAAPLPSPQKASLNTPSHTTKLFVDLLESFEVPWEVLKKETALDEARKKLSEVQALAASVKTMQRRNQSLSKGSVAERRATLVEMGLLGSPSAGAAAASSSSVPRSLAGRSGPSKTSTPMAKGASKQKSMLMGKKKGSTPRATANSGTALGVPVLPSPRALLPSATMLIGTPRDFCDTGVQCLLDEDLLLYTYERIDHQARKEFVLDQYWGVLRVALSNILRLWVDIEVELSCRRCCAIIADAMVIAPCGTPVCRNCLVEQDDAAFDLTHFVECHCVSHDGTTPCGLLRRLSKAYAQRDVSGGITSIPSESLLGDLEYHLREIAENIGLQDFWIVEQSFAQLQQGGKGGQQLSEGPTKQQKGAVTNSGKRTTAGAGGAVLTPPQLSLTASSGAATNHSKKRGGATAVILDHEAVSKGIAPSSKVAPLVVPPTPNSRRRSVVIVGEAESTATPPLHNVDPTVSSLRSPPSGPSLDGGAAKTKGDGKRGGKRPLSGELKKPPASVVGQPAVATGPLVPMDPAQRRARMLEILEVDAAAVALMTSDLIAEYRRRLGNASVGFVTEPRVKTS